MFLLAYADVSDDSSTNLALVLVGLMVAGLAAVLAAVPVWKAWQRRHPHLEIIGAAMLIWAIAAAWSGISLYAARADWEKEKTLRIESGYDSNPSDASTPPLPVAFWTTLAAGWVGVGAWAFLMPIRTQSPAVDQGGTLQRRDPAASGGTGASPNAPRPNDPLSN